MKTKSLRYFAIILLLILLAGTSGDAQGQTGANANTTYLSLIHRDPNLIYPFLLKAEGNTSCVTSYKQSGDLWCWGENLTSLAGDPLNPQSLIPVNIPVQDVVYYLSMGPDFACFMNDVGNRKCWGKNNSGQLGNNTFDDSLSPVQVTGFTGGIVAFDSGDGFACAGTWNGVLFCWGKADRGQLGIGDRYKTDDPGFPLPQQITGLSGRISSIAAGAAHACAVVDNQLWCWGDNDHGQIGVGDRTIKAYLQPIKLQYFGEYVWEVYASGDTTCAFAGGGLYCWGDNEFGQVGNGSSGNDVLAPAHVYLPDGYPGDVSVGRSNTCAVTLANTLFCWGRGDQGQIGNGQISDVFDTPQRVNDFGQVGGVSVGDAHTCASTWSQKVLCWGDNQYGQLGDGTTDDRSTPVYVVR